jgi:hypothetical protein
MSVIEEIGLGLLPTPYFETIDTSATSSSKINIKASVVLRDSKNDSGNCHWVDTVIHEYMEVTFMTVVTFNSDNTNETVVEQLNNGLMNPLMIDNSNDGIYKQTKNVLHLLIDDEEYYISEGGEKIYNLYFSFDTIEIPKIDVRSVYLYVCAHLPIEQVLIDGNVIEANFSEIDYFSSLIRSELIVQDGAVVV